MKYIAGVDGGASKTLCVIGDEQGRILSKGISSGSSYHTVGLDAAKNAVESAIAEAAGAIGIKREDISYTVLGMASADLESDFEVLGEAFAAILPPGRFKILNDTWIGLRAGISENWGVVSICGTGGACAGRNKAGEEVRLLNLSYELGNCGGGADIARMALHYAFRSKEKTGPATALEHEIPKAMGRESLDDIVHTALTMDVSPEDIYEIPVLVGALACEGDAVCQDIFIKIGHEMGEIASGVIKRLNMEGERFAVTLIGSVFKSDCPLLFDEYTTTVHRAAPFADISVANEPPAHGAYYLALEEYSQLT